MGLLQKAWETFECHAHLAGVTREGHETLAPVSHLLTSAEIEITLDAEGRFVSARAPERAPGGSARHPGYADRFPRSGCVRGL